MAHGPLSGAVEHPAGARPSKGIIIITDLQKALLAKDEVAFERELGR
jgi:hypothetical protein